MVLSGTNSHGSMFEVGGKSSAVLRSNRQPSFERSPCLTYLFIVWFMPGCSERMLGSRWKPCLMLRTEPER